MNAISIFDTYMYSPLFTQMDMKAIWEEQHQIETWLTFEKTVAKVQAELNIIPYDAFLSIEKACNTLNIDWQRLSEETKSVGMPIKPLIDQITDNGDQWVKKYLHWGCTTQDLLDTSLAMRLNESLFLIRKQLIQLGKLLAEKAHKHRNTIMVARTNAIDASATTWGLQISSYLNEISRHIIRIDQLQPRVVKGMYGGAVGNLASVGKQGIAVRKKLCKALKLTDPQGLNNACQDHNAELVQFFALIHGTLCRIANDVELMCRTPIFEAREGKKGGGSSTMPHKTNPRDCNMLQTLARMGWMYAAAAPNMLDQQDVRSASMRMLNWYIMPESCMAASTALEKAKQLMDNLVINQDKMRENFNASYYFIMSESVMMILAEKIGRNNAYNILKDLLNMDSNNQSLVDILLESREISKHLTKDEIIKACDPINYLGCNDDLIQESLEYFNQLI